MKLNIDKILFQWSHRISSSELHVIESGSPCIMRNKQNHAKTTTTTGYWWPHLNISPLINLFTRAEYRIEVRSFTLADSSLILVLKYNLNELPTSFVLKQKVIIVLHVFVKIGFPYNIAS